MTKLPTCYICGNADADLVLETPERSPQSRWRWAHRGCGVEPAYWIERNRIRPTREGDDRYGDHFFGWLRHLEEKVWFADDNRDSFIDACADVLP